MCRLIPRLLACATLAAAVSLAGCRTQRGPAASAEPKRDAYLARPAAALVFDPPASYDLDRGRLADALDRAGRDRYAVLGYDSPVVETSFVLVDDRQNLFGYGGLGGFGYTGGYGYGGYGGYGGFGLGGGYDSYQRRAVSTRSFTRVR